MNTPRHRQSLETTRLECLEAGRQILAQRGFAAQDDLTMVEVANHLTTTSGVRRTTGFLYQGWPGGQLDYNRDLAAYVLHHDVIEGVAVLYDVAAHEMLSADDRDETIRVGAELALAQQLDGRGFEYFIRYWSYAIADESYASEVRACHDAFHDGVHKVYSVLMDRFGLEPRPPFTLHDITVTIAALIDGFALRTRFDPDRNTTHDLDGTEWSLFACAIDAIARGFTQPRSLPNQ